MGPLALQQHTDPDQAASTSPPMRQPYLCCPPRPQTTRGGAARKPLGQAEGRVQAQSMVMDTLGLAISVGLNTAVRHSQRASFLLPLAVLPVCGLGDLATIYAELKSTHLRSLNRERTELLAEAWLTRRQLLSAREVIALHVLCGGVRVQSARLAHMLGQLPALGLGAGAPICGVLAAEPVPA